MNLKIVLLILYTAILFGCQAIAKKSLGLRDPRVESKESIYKQAHKQGIDTSLHFYVVDSASANKIVSGNFPKIYFFNKNGDLILSDNCFELLKTYTDSLYKTDNFKPIKNNALPDELEKIRTFDNQKISLDLSQTDYVIVYYWATWMGKFNKNKIGWLDQKVMSDKRKNITLLKVNADMQKSWNWTKEQYEGLFQK